MDNILNNVKYIESLIVTAILLVVFSGEVFADDNCIKYYGGGEVCSYDNRFRIEKHVRVPETDEDWEDKVTDVSKDEIVEFRLVVENRSDTESAKFEEFDNFKYEDFLPDELEYIGGAGLTEYWGDFGPGEVKTFYIKAKLKDSEFEKNETFDKCVVNKVELYWNGDFEDSDIATVCYGSGEVLGLPSTGANEVFALLGIVMIAFGFSLKKQIA